MAIKLKSNVTVLALTTKAKRYGEYTVADHDAAVAHALVRAIDGVLGKTARRDVYDVAGLILEDDFGIIEEGGCGIVEDY